MAMSVALRPTSFKRHKTRASEEEIEPIVVKADPKPVTDESNDTV